MSDSTEDSSKEVMALSWHLSILGLYVVVAPFVFGFSGVYRWSLIAAGILIAVLAAWRSWQPDERVPQPYLPGAVVILGLYTLVSPFIFGNGLGDIAGISLVILGALFAIFPAPETLRTLRKPKNSP